MADQPPTYPGVAPPRLWSNPSAHFAASLEHPWYRAVSELLATTVETTQDFFRARDCRPVLMPLTVGSVSSPVGLGSDSIPVSVDLFGQRVYLADSMQFHLEMMLRQGFRGTYYIMPTFRGEMHDESHLNQFFHAEAEIVGDFAAVLALVEDYVRALAVGVLASPVGLGQGWDVGLTHVEELTTSTEFPRVSHAEMLERLPDDMLARTETGDLLPTRRGEVELIRQCGGVVWLTHPPARTVPFYQADDGHGRALAADLLLGPGEVVGCGQRHDTRSALVEALAAHEVDAADYRWYLEMKERAPMRTAGFGLGMERFLQWVLRADDIRDLHLLPRLRGVRPWA